MPAKKPPTEHAIRVNVSLPPVQLAALDRVADALHGGNRSAAIGELAEKADAVPPKSPRKRTK